MVHIARWKIILVILVCLLSVVYALPNVLGRDGADKMAASLPSWLPTRTVNLGLDLQGGSHLLLEVATNVVITERLNGFVDSARTALRQAKMNYVDLGVSGPAGLAFTVRDPADIDAARKLMGGLDPDLIVTTEDNRVTARLSDSAIEARKRAAIDQSMEIVRRRIDETGTKEPSIQREGDDRIVVQLPGVDNPQHVKDLLGQTAKLAFRLVDDMTDHVPPADELLVEKSTGQPLLIQKRVLIGGDNLVDAQPGFGQDGRAVVNFRFDSLGARRFADASRDNVGRRFAIVLDNKVITAPVINEPILNGSGQISGNFTTQTASDLALLLRAGALPAPLTVIEERTVGPGLGADSIVAGRFASIVGLGAVVVFMLASYGLFGLFANVALVFNVTLIFAALSILQATLTLPGIAGMVLTIAVAVDANVLVFERIREEVRAGRTVISAIDAGYARALTTIVDSNFTTLIAAVLLYLFGSGPVKGFAVTLTIGILASMFTAIMVTRLMVVGWLRRTRPKAIPI